MSAASASRFDESLASVARDLHLAELSVLATIGAMALFLWLERRGRARWMQVPLGDYSTSRIPYRASVLVVAHLAKAPRLVRTAAFTCLAFGQLFAPLIVVALTKYPFDGIAIPLVPGLALVALNWSCAWLLLARSPLATAIARSGAVGSLMANIGLLGIAAAHFAAVELQRRDGLAHACSSSVTFVVIVFAVLSVVQALVMMAALRSHSGVLDWQVSTGSIPPSAAMLPLPPAHTSTSGLDG